MRAIRICCVGLVIALIPAIHARFVRADERLDALIKNVEAAENRIKYIDVEFVTTITNGDPATSAAPRPLGESTVSHQVVQGIAYSEMNSHTIREQERALPGWTSRSEYDGRMTRYDSGRGEGTVHVGSFSDPVLFHPHRHLYNGGRDRTPLSRYLKGYDGPPPTGQKKSFPAFEKVEYDGEVELEGFKCKKVSLTSLNSKTGRPRIRNELWIAKERSWLPVRSTCIEFEVSDKLETGVGTSDDLREIEPGVWFPFRTIYTAWHKPTLLSSGRKELNWKRETKIERVSLKPEYPIEFFRQIEFADGTKVTEYAAGRKGRTYVVGASETAAEESSEPWYARVPWKKAVPGSAAALVILYAIWAGRRKRSNVTPS